MQSIKEQTKEINRRRQIYSEMKTLKKKIIVEASSFVVITALIIFVVSYVPKIALMSAQAPMKQYGSMILSLPPMTYILIAVLAFILGVVATLLCQHIKKHRKKEREIR